MVLYISQPLLCKCNLINLVCIQKLTGVWLISGWGWPGNIGAADSSKKSKHISKEGNGKLLCGPRGKNVRKNCPKSTMITPPINSSLLFLGETEWLGLWQQFLSTPFLLITCLVEYDPYWRKTPSEDPVPLCTGCIMS